MSIELHYNQQTKAAILLLHWSPFWFLCVYFKLCLEKKKQYIFVDHSGSRMCAATFSCNNKFSFFFFILPDENDEKWFEWGINEKKTVRIKQKPNGSTAWNGIRNRTNENEVDSYNFTFGISHCLNIENYKATINPAIFSVVVVEINALESGSRQRPRWITTRVVDIWYGAWKHITNSIPKSRC